LGQPQSYVSKYETGERRLDFVETVLVCRALGVEIEDFAATFSDRLRKAGRQGHWAVKIDPNVTFQSAQSTAKKAVAILIAKNVGFRNPTAKQRQNLLVAFAKRGKVVYGKAFDVVKTSASVDLDDLAEVEASLDEITVFEIKSSRKKLRPDFSGFFFALTGAEVLVAQSLRKQFKFVLVNTGTGDHIEISLSGIFSRAKGIYPTWSICFWYHRRPWWSGERREKIKIWQAAGHPLKPAPTFEAGNFHRQGSQSITKAQQRLADAHSFRGPSSPAPAARTRNGTHSRGP
jgi:hypothetical protein